MFLVFFQENKQKPFVLADSCEPTCVSYYSASALSAICHTAFNQINRPQNAHTNPPIFGSRVDAKVDECVTWEKTGKLLFFR